LIESVDELLLCMEQRLLWELEGLRVEVGSEVRVCSAFEGEDLE
jgi:hypothetical protein